MTGELVPIVEHLARCSSHSERALWLLACPIDMLRRYEMTIRNRLMLAGCHAGLDYLEVLHVVMSATRGPETGLPTNSSVELLLAAADRLRSWAAERDGYDMPTADPTDL